MCPPGSHNIVKLPESQMKFKQVNDHPGPTIHQIMTKSFVRTLLEISRMEHRDTQQRVVIAVYRISCCKRGRELLLEEGAPESLIRLISKPNEEMRKVGFAHRQSCI